MDFSVLIKVSFDTKREAEIVSKSISVDSAHGSRSRVDISTDDNDLILGISASDLGALRAAINSYLRQVKIANDAIS